MHYYWIARKRRFYQELRDEFSGRVWFDAPHPKYLSLKVSAGHSELIQLLINED